MSVRGAGILPRPATLLAFAIACCLFLPFVRYGLNVEDEGALLAEFYRIHLGEVPVRDVHMGYTPGAYYFHSALFSAFGVSTTPVRLALVVCHATLFAMLFALGRRCALPAMFAVLPPLLYCAVMPFSAGSFASFNIPYPAWYTALFAVVSAWALVRFVETRHRGWLAVAGAAAGLSFSFKPNAGVFLTVAAALTMLATAESRGRRGDALWWLLASALVPAVVVAFGAPRPRDLVVFVLPLAAMVALLVVRRVRAVAEPATAPPSDADTPSAVVGPHLATSLAAYIAGVAAPVLPWAIGLLAALGPELFARRVLFFGAGYERSYYIPFHEAGRADAALVLGALGLACAGWLVRARRLPPVVVGVTAVVAALGAVAVLARAPMPQGFQLAVRLRAEDLAHGATLITVWGGIVAIAPSLLGRAHTPDLRAFVLVASALSALLVVYPRSDFMHLVTALPLVTLLAVVLTHRVIRWFAASSVALGRAAAVALVGATLGMAVIFAAPRLGSLLEWNGGPALRPRAWLDVARAPIWLERGRAPELRALGATVAYVVDHTAPSDSVFPFPAIELVCFLADRRNPTRFGYFYPGWPGHDVEAEVVTALRTTPPRLVVVVHAPQFFFHGAAAYYYVLRADVERRYRPTARFGPYVVLARDADPTPPPGHGVDLSDVVAALDARYGPALRGAPETRVAALRALAGERVDVGWPPLVGAITDPSAAVRRAAFDAVAETRNPDIALAVARALAADAVPPERREAALRLVHSSADARALPALLAVRRRSVRGERPFIDAIIGTIAEKLVASDYWLGAASSPRTSWPDGVEASPAAAIADVDVSDERRRYLAWLAPSGGGDELRSALERAVDSDDDPDLVTAAARSLVHGGFTVDDDAVAAALIGVVGREPLFAPAVLLELHARAPAAVVRAIADAMPHADVATRAELAWVAAACADPALRATLVALQSSPDRAARTAAVFGLARLDDADGWRRVEEGTRDRDVEVRTFAAQLIRAERPRSGPEEARAIHSPP